MTRENSHADLAIAKLTLQSNQKDLHQCEAAARRRGLITDPIVATSAILSIGIGFGIYFYTGNHYYFYAVGVFWIIAPPVYKLFKGRITKKNQQIELEKFRNNRKLF